jgi:bis(5'-adenosyl)-triphosphatase
MNNDCPFCDPEVVNIAFAEESGFYAVYNHAPVVTGHSLVIPNKHVTDLLHLNSKEYADFFAFARKVVVFLNNYYNTSEFDMTIQQGENAGQSVAHLHLHILPRKANDLPEGEEWFHKLNEDEFTTLDSKTYLSNEELQSISRKLRIAWKAVIGEQKV